MIKTATIGRKCLLENKLLEHHEYPFFTIIASGCIIKKGYAISSDF